MPRKYRKRKMSMGISRVYEAPELPGKEVI